MSLDTAGELYLLHFTVPLTRGDPPIEVRHYLGWALPGALEARLEEHRAGQGAKITAAAVQRGSALHLAWCRLGTPRDERRLKAGGHIKDLCRACGL